MRGEKSDERCRKTGCWDNLVPLSLFRESVETLVVAALVVMGLALLVCSAVCSSYVTNHYGRWPIFLLWGSASEPHPAFHHYLGLPSTWASAFSVVGGQFASISGTRRTDALWYKSLTSSGYRTLTTVAPKCAPGLE